MGWFWLHCRPILFRPSGFGYTLVLFCSGHPALKSYWLWLYCRLISVPSIWFWLYCRLILFRSSGPQIVLTLVTLSSYSVPAISLCWFWLHCRLILFWPSDYAGFGYTVVLFCSGHQLMLVFGYTVVLFCSGHQIMLILVTLSSYSVPAIRLCWFWLHCRLILFRSSGRQNELALVTMALRVCWLWLQWSSECAGFGYSGP